MDRFDDDILFAELRALRPTPRPEFIAELDERAAAGFPRGESSSAASTPFARFASWWRAASSTRRLAPVFAVLVIGLVTTTVVIATTNGGGEVDTIAGTMENRELELVPNEKTSKSSSTNSTLPPAAASVEGEELDVEPEEESGRAKGHESSVEDSVNQPAVPGSAAVIEQRNIERSAYVVLGTKPGEVSAAAAKVYEAVHASGGVVLHSSVQSGKAGATGASFDLLIPSRKLDDALGAFSQIAEVRERHDATNDITAPTVSAAEELADSNARVDSLLKELGDAETEEERESVEVRLREERGRHASIRSALDHLHDRASMSEVTVRIVTGNGAGVAPAGKGDDGDWGVGDALGDAGDILTIAAGVALLGLAVLGPIALVAILFWAANRFRLRRLRERTLG